EHVVSVESQDPVRCDPGLVSSETPLRGVTVERPVDNSDIGEASGDGQRLVSRAAIHDDDLSGPRQALEGPADVRRFVERQDDGSDVGEHARGSQKIELCDCYKTKN